MTQHCCPLILNPEALQHYASQLGNLGNINVLESLVQTIARDIRLQHIPGATLVARESPYPAIAIFGEFQPETAHHVIGQLQILNNACRLLRYVDYTTVTQACETLAQRILQAFHPEQIETFHFVGIPRGGLIVLGILSYLLKLKAPQLEGNISPGKTVVIVDDCAISGGRFTESLAEYSEQSIIFAPLFSHPDLRHAIAQESNVLTCISGADLHDHGAATLGDNYPKWQSENLKRLDSKRFWLGQPDYICFPWNEPDHLLWNPALNSLEKAWRIVPGEICLKNRASTDQTAIKTQTQPMAQGSFSPHPDIIWMQIEETVTLGHLKTGETFALDGVAADIWRSLISQPSQEKAISALAQLYDIEEATIQPDVEAFSQQLIRQNLLEIPS